MVELTGQSVWTFLAGTYGRGLVSTDGETVDVVRGTCGRGLVSEGEDVDVIASIASLSVKLGSLCHVGRS